MPTFEERFRAVADWCTRNNVAAGFPNCHENTNVTPALYGTILIPQGVSWQDVPRSTLGNPNSVRFSARPSSIQPRRHGPSISTRSVRESPCCGPG